MDWNAFLREHLNEPAAVPDWITRIWSPRTPRSVAELSLLTRESGLTTERLVRTIETDSELASQVLKLVNSCAVGLNKRIHAVSHALSLLGLRRGRMLVLGALLQAAMRGKEADALQHEQFLLESLERALYARFAAEVLGLDTERAYIAGLLQDFLLPHLQREQAGEYARYRPEDGKLVEFERALRGADHALVGARVLARWNFPADIVSCVLMHHRSEEVLHCERLSRSLLVTTLASGLLPDALRQEPGGVRDLFRMQELLPQFQFLEIAARVDEELEAMNLAERQPSPLSDRLSRLACALVEQYAGEIEWTERRVGSYILEQEIGQGSMGVVYRARHVSLLRPAAIKLMKGTLRSAEAIQSFEREAQLTSSLTSPHTVQIYDYGATPEGILYYVMEYLRGLSLGELVERYGAQEQSRVVQILIQACDSLAEAHTLGLVHRDIKPENLFLTVRGDRWDFVKVLDFGLVKNVRPAGGSDESRNVCGTPLYLAPEAILSPNAIDPRADLYALGLVAFYLLTGQSPFAGTKTRDILFELISVAPTPPSEKAVLPIDRELEQLILDCLAKRPADRPQSAQELGKRLAALPLANEWTQHESRQWWHLNRSVATPRSRHQPAAATMEMHSRFIDKVTARLR